jgi:Xaa-Pro aminopeptidase
VYVPESGYGVRIEDIVVLRADGAENLTKTSKALLTV